MDTRKRYISRKIKIDFLTDADSYLLSQGSKLNPGAPEFTPRSATTPVRTVAAFDRCSWADDVQAAADKQSHTVTSPIFDITASGDHIHNELEHTTPKHGGLKQMDGSPDVRMVPGFRRPEPQDTSRSVSDPVHDQPPNSPSTLTLTKSEPPLQKTPNPIGALQNDSARRDAPPHRPSAAQNVGTHGDMRQNKTNGHQQDAASGSRGRGSHNRQNQRGGTRGRGRRPPSNTYRRGESVAATSSSAKQP